MAILLPRDVAKAAKSSATDITRLRQAVQPPPSGPGAFPGVGPKSYEENLNRFREVDRATPIPQSRETSYYGRSGRPQPGEPQPARASLGDALGSVGNYALDTTKRIPGDIGNTLGIVGSQLDRPRGAFFGSIAGSEAASNPLTGVLGSVTGAVEGFRNPQAFQGRDSSLGRTADDTNRYPFGLSNRDVLGGVLDVAFDPTDLALGGTVGTDLVKAGRKGIKALGDDATEAAIRAAEGPLETSTLGHLRPAKPSTILNPSDPRWAERAAEEWNGNHPMFDALSRGAATLPEPAPGTVRLWRGENSSALRGVPGLGLTEVGGETIGAGRFFTEDPYVAFQYSNTFAERGDIQRVFYIDVPRDVADAARYTPPGYDDVTEFVLSPDLARSRKQVPLVVAESTVRQPSPGAVQRATDVPKGRARVSGATFEPDVFVPEVARASLPESTRLSEMAAQVRGEIKYTKAGVPVRSAENVARTRQLGELEALADIRRIADTVGDDYGEMVRQLEEHAARASDYANPQTARRVPGARAPAFGSAERVQWELARKASNLGDGGKQRGAIRSRPEAPFVGPKEAVRAYEDTLTDAIEKASVSVTDLPVIREPGVASIPDGLPKTAASQTPEFEQGYPSLLDALRNEVRLRRSGVVEAEKAAGRSQQAAGVAEGLARGQGLEGRLAAARSGARVGSLRKTLTPPIELTRAQTDALSDHLVEALSDEQTWKQFSGQGALSKLINGESVQPAELKLLRRAFGDEVAKLAREASQGRISAVAQLDDAAKAAIDRAAEIGEKQIARYEQRAIAQRKLADDLTERLNLDPTNQRLATVTEQARVKGLEAANKADELTLEQGRRYQAAVEAKGARANAADAKQAARGNAAAVKAGERADRLNPNEQMLIDKAKTIIAEAPSGTPAANAEALKSIEYWLQAAKQYRESIGETGSAALAQINAHLTGNLADSYLTKLYQNREVAIRALEMGGTDPAIARKVADLLVDAELKARYPGGIPTRIANEIAKTKLAYGGNALDTAFKGAAAVSQEWKNLAFGPADMGIMGQQVLGAANMAPSNILAGAVNRVLTKMGHPMFDDPLLAGTDGVARKLQYARDGLAMNVSTGAVQPGEGLGLLNNFGPGGRAINRLTAYNTRLQFDKILGGLRNLDHEGNLMILKATGQDVTDPAVRATSARFANTATSYAPQALNARRAAGETALLMTPSMRRAQVSFINDMAKVFLPGTTKAERTLGAVAILNKVAVTLAVAKLVHDNIGVGDFIMDPSAKGFGNITTKMKNSKGENIVINLFPQQQIQRTILQSIRALSEGDPQEAADMWIKLGIGTSGPVLQGVEKLFGYGYQPGQGYKMGDYGEGMSVLQKVAAIAPIPPIAQSAMQGELSPQSAPLEFFGVQNYPESSYGEQQRLLGSNETLTGRERTQELGSTPEGLASLERRDREVLDNAAKGDRTAKALAVGVETRQRISALADSNLSGSQYRDERKIIMAEQRGKLEAFADVFDGFRQSDIPAERDASAYFDLYDQAQTPWGTTDYDRFEEIEAQFIADIGDARWQDVQGQLNLIDPRLAPREQEYRQVRQDLEGSGYFAIRDQSWAAVKKAIPGAAKYPDYYAWRDAMTQKFITNLSKSLPPGVAETEAARLVEQFPQANLYSQFKNARETQWIAKNPSLADKASLWGYLTTNADERSLITLGAR